MGRPLYPYELGDPDFAWLLSNFTEQHPGYVMLDSTCLPVVFIKTQTDGVAQLPTAHLADSSTTEAMLPPEMVPSKGSFGKA